jgi:hypothetical protein
MIKKESDLEEIYDRSLEQMIVDIVHVRDKGCPYCHKPVDIIEQGLGAITLDIFNAELCHTIPLTWFGAALDVTAKNSGLPLKCGVRGSPLASLAAKSGTARR